ncbi:helix-turn-helix domain-containing protein [Chryseobacterium indologenes]|uniref:helix-turn-helix domain-containing protein n=1 Tax=Chryseobacterium indologenes TaxID=253 RepID=UPI001BCACF4F|nr:helix-turn-helix transcriptional regulator [Chryseobacterium indologenes]
MKLRIKEICDEKGIMQKELAERINITEVGLSKSLNGNPTLQRLIEIAEALGVPFLELFEKNPNEGEPIYRKDDKGNEIIIGYLKK